MADTSSAPNMAAPFNALIAQNQAPPQNPLTQALTQANGLAQTQGAFANAQRAGYEADDARLANAQNHMAMITSAMAPVIAMGPNVTLADVAKAGQNLVASTKGAISGDEISHFITNELPTNGDGAAIAQSLRLHQLRLLGAQQQIQTLRGDTVTTNTGGQTQFGTRNTFTGAYTPQAGPNGSLTNTMSPAEAAAPQNGPPDPTTFAPTTITYGQRAEAAGQAAPGTYTGHPPMSLGQPDGSAVPISISRDGQITRRASPVMGAPMMPRANGPMVTGVSPGQGVALKAGGDAYAAASQNAGTYGQQMTQLQSALSGLQNTSTGPGTESRQAIASYMLALPGGVGAYLPGVDPKSIAAYDEANKYLTQAAQGSPNATRSDAGLSTALAASPSVHISNAAAQDVLKANIGFRRAEMANLAAFQNSGQDPGQFQTFMAQRNQTIDPRAYSIDLLSPAQRSSFIAGLSPAAKTKFFSSVRDAMSSGMIDTSALSGGGAGGR